PWKRLRRAHLRTYHAHLRCLWAKYFSSMWAWPPGWWGYGIYAWPDITDGEEFWLCEKLKRHARPEHASWKLTGLEHHDFKPNSGLQRTGLKMRVSLSDCSPDRFPFNGC